MAKVGLPADAVHWAKVAILDTVGCILAGANADVTVTAVAAGSLAGNIALALTSNANGVTGLDNVGLTAGAITVTGAAYDLARADFAATAVAFGFDEIETTMRVSRHSWSNALACCVGSGVGRAGTLFQCSSEEAEELLQRAFRDPLFRERNFPRWLEIAGSPKAAERLLPTDAATVIVGAVLISLVATLYPASKAASLPPTEGLRSE